MAKEMRDGLQAMVNLKTSFSSNISNLQFQDVSKNIFGPKSLTDLIRGIRAHKKDERTYISQCLQEIKEEIKEQDHHRKAQAVAKLTYLQMLGYDIGWASFYIIEVMSQPGFTNRRIGYLAASQTFHEGTEELILCTSLLKRSCMSVHEYEAGLALTCLANICTPDLARDLAPDIVNMLNSARPYIRKKAVLVLYKIFLKFQGALRPAFPRLKERLEDEDQSVISAAVNVICELARKNPKNYLTLAPTLFKILQSSNNNWMLIKIIKLFASLAPLEKRLARRLVDPLTNLINTTTAASLLYECIQTCIIGMPHKISLMKLCIDKLRVFVEDPDQNLKYLGLVALTNIMKVHPKAVAEHRELVVRCLDDADETIRLRALELIGGMVNERNLRDIIERLLVQLDKCDSSGGISASLAYKDELISKIVELCHKDDYSLVDDFEWYVGVLLDLARAASTGAGSKHGKLLADQLMDVIIRVEDVRAYGVRSMAQLLFDPRFFTDAPGLGASSFQEVLYAAVWIVGEFARYLRGGPTQCIDIVETLLHPKVYALPPHIQAVYMQCILKLFAHAIVMYADQASMAKEGQSVLERITKIVLDALPKFQQSTNLEVQERACFAFALISLVSEMRKAEGQHAVAKELVDLFTLQLNPVASGAQARVPVPKGLDLEKQINELPPEMDASSSSDDEYESDSKRPWWEDEKQSRSERVYPRSSRPSSSPYHLGPSTSSSADEVRARLEGEFGDRRPSGWEPDPPIASVEELGIKDPFRADYRRSRKDRKGHRQTRKKATVKTGFEWHPESVMESDGKVEASPLSSEPLSGDKKDGIYADVDLNRPLEAHEMLSQPTWSPSLKKAEDDKKKEVERKKSTSRKDRKKGEAGGRHRHRHHHRHHRSKEDEAKRDITAKVPADNPFEVSYRNAPKLDFPPSPTPTSSLASVVGTADLAPDPYGAGYANIGSPTIAAAVPPTTSVPQKSSTESLSPLSKGTRKRSGAGREKRNRKEREKEGSAHTRRRHHHHRHSRPAAEKESQSSQSVPQ